MTNQDLRESLASGNYYGREAELYEARIAELEAENERLQEQLDGGDGD